MTPEITEKAVVVQTHQLLQANRRMWELDRMECILPETVPLIKNYNSYQSKSLSGKL